MADRRFLQTSSDQFLSKRDDVPSEDAVFAWFSPPEPGQDRVKFLVTREEGDDLSILPGSEGRFKRGLRAWRWEDEEVTDHQVYVVVKTRHNRIDLRRLPS